RSGEPYSIPLGSSYNIWSVMSENANAINYDPVLNAMVFCHRQNSDAAGGSGIISFDVSVDGGATWDATNKQVTPLLMTPEGTVINGNRYPSGGIYNPPGNTDVANAKFVGVGPALWTHPDFGDNGWGWEFIATADFDGSNATEDYYTTVPDSAAYLPTSLVMQPDGSLWYANLKREARTAATTLEQQYWNPVMATKLVFDENGGYTRTVTELELNQEGAISNTVVDPRIAFSPDGQTGYVVIRGTDADDDPEFPSFKPIIWKSTDAGDTWVKQSRVDFQAMDTLQAWTIPVDGDGDGAPDSLAQGSPQVPFMSMFDMVVDAEGKLHIFGSMLSSSDTTDSQFGFVWIGAFATELFHFITDGEDWEDSRVGGYYNEDGSIGTDGFINERLQASRSADGQYIFFTHSETYFEDDAEERLNNNPDIYGYAYRISDGKKIFDKNFGVVPGFVWEDFEFTDAAFQSFLHMTSPVAITGGEQWDHELPIVYGVPSDVGDDLAPINYYYYYGAGFDETEFDPVSTEEPVIKEGALKVFPNPATNHLWINFELIEESRVAIDLFDLTGRKVASAGTADYVVGPHSKYLEIKNMPQGTYFVRVQTNNQVATSKVVIK
ncbi:MAG: T9SS C-terminal target domain-containing protein, partial [Bacteroidetes bacterium]